MFNRISSQDLVDFTKNLAMMLKSGLTITEALQTLTEQAKSRSFQKILERIRTEIEAGTSLGDALGKDEAVFGNVFVNLTAAGESSGTLDQNLAFLSEWLERNHDLKNDVRAALLYPKIVLAATFLLGGMLTVFVLPRLVPLFTSLRITLPLATRILIAISNFLEHYWFFALLGAIALIGLFKFLNRMKPARRVLHRVYLSTPFIETFVKDYQLALITYVLSTLLRGGLSLNEVLAITANTATIIQYQDSLLAIKERVGKGTTIAEAMKEYPLLFPPNLTNMVAVGEKSGNLDNSFEHSAAFYTQEVKHKTKKLPTIIEPILLIMIGLIVGFVAFSIIMPIYNLTSNLSR